MNYGINEMIVTYERPRHKRVRPRNFDTHIYFPKSSTKNIFKKFSKKS